MGRLVRQFPRVEPLTDGRVVIRFHEGDMGHYVQEADVERFAADLRGAGERAKRAKPLYQHVRAVLDGEA